MQGNNHTEQTHFVSFYSTRCGVGKTSLAVNTAFALSHLGQKVLLWEINFQSPSFHYLPIFSNLRHKTETEEMLFLPNAIDDQVKNITVYQDDYAKFHVLPSTRMKDAVESGLVPWDELYANGSTKGSVLFGNIYESIIRLHQPDFVLIDCESGFTNNAAIATLQSANTVVLAYDMPAAAQTKKTCDILMDRGNDPTFRKVPLSVIKVLNKLPITSADPVELYKRMNSLKTTGMQPDIRIPLHMSGVMPIHGHDLPDDIFGQQLKQLAAMLITKRGETHEFSKAHAPDGKRFRHHDLRQ
jgi:MinD-like ATPase involved in chromosome partitioning or flagellar assembly